MTPIIVTKNELRLVKTEQRLERSEQGNKEGADDLDGSNRQIFIQNCLAEEQNETSHHHFKLKNEEQPKV